MDLDALYKVADETFDLDLDTNFSEALSFLNKVRGVTNINAKNFLKRKGQGFDDNDSDYGSNADHEADDEYGDDEPEGDELDIF